MGRNKYNERMKKQGKSEINDPEQQQAHLTPELYLSSARALVIMYVRGSILNDIHITGT